MIFPRRKMEEPRIDLTSLVDVVFLLLIFFMISTTFIEAPGLGIDLPESGSQRPSDAVKEVKVILDAGGRIQLNGELVTEEQFRQRIPAVHKAQPTARLVLLADRRVPHGQVVRLMDLAQRAGFRKLAIATDPAPVNNKE